MKDETAKETATLAEVHKSSVWNTLKDDQSFLEWKVVIR